MPPLSPETQTTIRACIPVLERHGLAITEEMYQRLLVSPDIRDLFNMSHQHDGEQPKALAFAVLAYARHIHQPAYLTTMIERITAKHVGLNIQPEHYPLVGHALLGAIAHVLGEAATPSVMKAWDEAYHFLAHLLIEREQSLYNNQAQQQGGWVGWRPFHIVSRQNETDHVVSFILRPTDGQSVLPHRPGQYLTSRITIPNVGSARRNYSISSAPSSDYYRITVKRHPQGIVSPWLHEHGLPGEILDISAPSGNVTLPQSPCRPLTLISVGIGITPMVSMMEALTQKNIVCPIHFIHGTRSPLTHLFSRSLHTWAQHPHIHTEIFYSETTPQRDLPHGQVHHGRITPHILSHSLKHDSDFYLCGPISFLKDMITTLRHKGIASQHIHYDLFGSTADPFLTAIA